MYPPLRQSLDGLIAIQLLFRSDDVDEVCKRSLGHHFARQRFDGIRPRLAAAVRWLVTAETASTYATKPQPARARHRPRRHIQFGQSNHRIGSCWIVGALASMQKNCGSLRSVRARVFIGDQCDQRQRFCGSDVDQLGDEQRLQRPTVPNVRSRVSPALIRDKRRGSAAPQRRYGQLV